MSDLVGLRIVRAEVSIPPTGAWFGTALLDSTSLPAVGPTVLTIGDLSLVGAVVRAYHDDAYPTGALASVVLRGGAGWRLPVPQAGSYAGSAVRLSTVLADLARMAGETISQPSDVAIGQALTWQAHTRAAPVHLEDVLADLVWRGYLRTWRVDPPTGVTRFDDWPSRGQADGRGRITSRALARGRRTVGLDVQVAAFLPGASLEGATIRRTVLYEVAQSLTAEVYEQ